MGLFDWFRKDKSEKKPNEEIEFTVGGSNYEERIGPFGERIVKGEFQRVKYKGTSEEIKQIIGGGGQPRNNILINRSNEPRRLRSASADDDEL
ncbi:hypothetical protein F7734_23380 [Scytonema sp. UIC 10036]|uniref:hypothetical protein n=1 Tax=Scytonema sp. UIC 10036 TaxID=2304196 RepID=UPI0012DA707D|nr:hypothetical protein [Scytonema sp. UIC 10036]MUG95143.1 hypothetical protein [Scytonema sp. UIC 10036]